MIHSDIRVMVLENGPLHHDILEYITQEPGVTTQDILKRYGAHKGNRSKQYILHLIDHLITQKKIILRQNTLFVAAPLVKPPASEYSKKKKNKKKPHSSLELVRVVFDEQGRQYAQAIPLTWSSQLLVQPESLELVSRSTREMRKIKNGSIYLAHIGLQEGHEQNLVASLEQKVFTPPKNNKKGSNGKEHRAAGIVCYDPIKKSHYIQSTRKKIIRLPVSQAELKDIQTGDLVSFRPYIDTKGKLRVKISGPAPKQPQHYKTVSQAAADVFDPTPHGLPSYWLPSVEHPNDVKREILSRIQYQNKMAAKARWRFRKDLQSVPFIAVDAKTTKDRDDAICFVQHSDGSFDLYVAIADVIQYSPIGDASFNEALRRGNTTYFPDSAEERHMYPAALSCDASSLDPDKHKSAFVSITRYNKDGHIIDSDVVRARIKVRAAFYHEEVDAALETGSTDNPKLQEHLTALQTFWTLTKTIQLARTRARQQQGKADRLEVKTTQPKAILNEQNQAVGIQSRDSSTPINQIIEEAALAGNIAMTKKLRDSGQPFICRVHGTPRPAVVERIKSQLAFLGYPIKASADNSGSIILNQALRRVIKAVRGTPDEELVNHLIIRMNQQAFYSAQPQGHYGLGIDGEDNVFYGHNTSPIRRFSDVVNQFGLAYAINKNDPDGINLNHIKKKAGYTLHQIAKHCSKTERASSEVVEMAMERLMINTILSQLDHTRRLKKNTPLLATITDISAHAISIRFHKTSISYEIPFDNLPTQYNFQYDDSNKALIGSHDGTYLIYQFGAAISVLASKGMKQSEVKLVPAPISAIRSNFTIDQILSINKGSKKQQRALRAA